MGGEKLYILTSSEDVRSLHRNAKTFTFNDVVFDVIITFGTSYAAILKMRQMPSLLEDWSNMIRVHCAEHAGPESFRAKKQLFEQ